MLALVLLIVVVIIGILSVVIIVAYNGIQNRAKTSLYLSDIATIVKKSELYPLASAGQNTATITTQSLSGQILTAGINFVNETTLPSNVVIFGVLTDTASLPTNSQAITAATARTSARGYFVKYCSTDKGMYVYYADASAAASATVSSKTVGVCP